VHDDDKPTSVWKKEISFRRKPREDGDGASGGSIWKKEISLRKKDEDDPVAAVLPEPLEPDPIDVDLAALVVPAPMVVPGPPAQEPPAASSEPPPLEVSHDWLTAPLEEISEPPAEPVVPAAVSTPDPVEPAPPARPPLHALPELPQEPEAAPAPALEPDPVLPPEPAAAPAPAAALVDADIVAAFAELVEPAEAAAAEIEEELAAAPTAELPPPKVPFYKRELSFGRKPKGEREQAPKQEKQAKPSPSRKTRKEKPAAAPQPQVVAAEAAPTKVPFYKRELSFGRKPKSAPAPVAAAPVEQEPAVAAAPKAPRAKPSLPKLSLPQLPSLGRGGKSIVGLKIGASQLAAARVANGKEPELLQAVRQPLEPGIVVGGELREPEELAEALKVFFKRNRLPKRGIRLGIANNRIGVRTFEVAGIDDPKQLDNAIKFRAQEVLPIPIEEAVLDYQVLSESRNEDGALVRRVLLVVAYRELVDRYVYACRKAGLQIVGIDLEAFALLRALGKPVDLPADAPRGAVVAVAVGHERSTFAVSDGKTCEFTRVLEWGGWALNVAIARALDIAPSEAEEIKRALSLAGTQERPDGVSEEQLEVARDAARKQLGAFARELVSSLQFYQNQPNSLGISEIVVTGGTTHLPGFAAELERLIGVPVRVGDPLARLNVSKKVRERAQVGSLAVAIGLGIED